jgi:hypothetical protein
LPNELGSMLDVPAQSVIIVIAFICWRGE